MFNQFAPEPPIMVRADPRPFYLLWRHQFWLWRITLSANLLRVKWSSKPYQNEHNSVKDAREKGKLSISLRSWRYCVGARLKFWRRSRVPKKGSRDEAVEILVTAPPSNLTWLYYKRLVPNPFFWNTAPPPHKIPPATQANYPYNIDLKISMKIFFFLIPIPTFPSI